MVRSVNEVARYTLGITFY